jgi:IS5 family transposase
MGKRRFKELSMGSFFGQFVYERVVPRDHFLVKLNQLIRWEDFVDLLLPAYKGLAETGRPPYSPEVILKMLVVARLYNISERQVEEAATYHLAIKEFVGLGVDEAAPDHSTLTEFKTRLRKAGAWSRFEALHDGVLEQARTAGIQFGSVQVVDSVHTIADVDNEADRKRQEQGRPPRDPQAQLVKKGKRRQTGPDGKVKTEEVQYLGYKSHVSMNAETGLITSILPSRGSAADNKQFAQLLAHDEELGVGATIYAGDRAYDDTDLHYRLWESGKSSALALKAYRTAPDKARSEFWQQVQDTPEYQMGKAERYKIERKFGEAKRWHGFARCRYLGLVRYGIQAYLTALALNLKQIVTLLTGVRFKPGSRKTKLALAA